MLSVPEEFDFIRALGTELLISPSYAVPKGDYEFLLTVALEAYPLVKKT